MKKYVFFIVSVLLLGILAACSSSNTNQSTEQTPTEGTSTSSSSNVIKIATHTPLSGSNAIIGEAIKLGAQMKLEEEAARFEEMGFTLQLEPYDDQADPKKGVSNANLIGADEAI